MTNKEKYQQIFGHEPDIYSCINNDMVCYKCPYDTYGNGCSSKWWNMPYKPPVITTGKEMKEKIMEILTNRAETYNRRLQRDEIKKDEEGFIKNAFCRNEFMDLIAFIENMDD